MSELPHNLRKAFEVISNCFGIDVAVVSHEGLLYEYRGDSSRAEELAATAPSRLGGSEEPSFAVVHSGDSTILAARVGGYAVAFEGEESALQKYLAPLVRIVRGAEARCSYCGFELDSAVVTCPRCGARHPFTLHSCPSCGYAQVVRRCPRCGKLVDEEGRRIVVKKVPFATALGALSGVVLALTTFVLAPLPELVSLSFIVPTVLGGIADLLTKPRVAVG